VRRIVVGPGVVALATVLVVALAAPALANHTDLTDPEDTGGLLDLRVVVLRHDSGPYEWIFKTYGSWTVRKLWDRGAFVIQLDTLRDEAVDYFVVVRSDGRSMVADLFRKRASGKEIHMRKLRARRAGSRGAAVLLPRAAVRYGTHRTSFLWRTLSTFTGETCRVTCIDRAPDDGSMVEQELEPPPPPDA
jgi:hypothetical protein